MKYILLSITVGLIIILSGCGKPILPLQPEPTLPTESTSGQIITGEVLPQEVDMTNKEAVADYIINALKEGNSENLEKVTSSEGITFSPYSYVDTGRHITIKKEELIGAFSGETEYVRGSIDGTGEPILMTLKRYIKRYVYDVDFQKLAKKTFDNSPSRGNMINNVNDIYTGLAIVEYYIPMINVQYEGMDRKALTLILQQENNERKLRAIIHHERTI